MFEGTSGAADLGGGTAGSRCAAAETIGMTSLGFETSRIGGVGAGMEVSVITGFDVVMVTLRDGELPHERRSALLLEREGALHSGVFKAMPFGCGLRPQP